MIIDQLPLLSGDVQSTDEIPIERGTTTYKTTQAALVKSAADAAAAAQSTADAAQTAADNAQTAAGNAQTSADAAQQTANGAQTTANGKVDKTVTLPSGTDLNTVITSGFYRLNDRLANAPSGGEWSQLIVSRGGDTIAQIIVSYNSGKMFVRAASGIGSTPSWTSWEEKASAWKLLWTNPNPNSNFAAQTISINTDGYERLKIDFNLNTESPAGSEIYFTSEVGLYFNRALFFCFYGGKYVQRATPAGWVTPSTLTFGDGQISNTYGAVPSTANNYLIPVRIYAQ